MLKIAPNIASLALYQPGKPIEETQRELGLSDVIKLASNENPLGPSKKAVAAIQEKLSQLHLYPDGSGFHLKRALAAFHGIATEQIVLGNGSNEIIEFLVRTVAVPGDNAVIGWPSFIVYVTAPEAAGLKVKRAAMPEFHYAVDRLLALVDERTRVVLIGHPNNPTGTYLPDNELRRLADALPSHVLLVVDEAYFEYGDASDYQSWLKCGRKNVFVLRTFSKAYGLAGIRLGYGVGDADLVSYLNRVREPFNVNSLALAAGVAALGDSEHVRRCAAENQAERTRISAAFAERGCAVVASQANFILVDFHRPAEPIFQALLKRGVITRPMKLYDLPNALRLSFGTRSENDRLITAIGDLLS